MNIEFNDIWDKQYKFEELFFKFNNIDINTLSIDEKRIWTKDFFSHIVVELAEVLDLSQYKMHRKINNSTINEGNIKESLIDSFKLLLGLSQLWFGDDCEEFYRYFCEKSVVVESRFEFEKIKNISKSNSNIIVVDIDGVLANIESTFFSEIQHIIGETKKYESLIDLKNTREIKNKDLIFYEEFKDKFRKSNRHQILPVFDGAKEFIDKLYELDYSVVVITARPYDKYRNLWYDTKMWLDNNYIKYDALFFDNQKHEKILEEFKDKLHNIKFIIDDTKHICDTVETLGIKSVNLDHKTIGFKEALKIIEDGNR